MSSQLLNSSLTFYIGLTVLLQLISISSCQSSNSSNYCTTPSGQRGQCINIRQCQPVITILSNVPNPIPKDTIKLLVSLGCGFEGRDPKVCCNTTYEPPAPDPAQPNYYSEAPPAVEGHPNLKLLPTNCGVVYEVRVAGGNKPKIFEFPWMARLAYNATSGEQFRCGGTVINERYILIAANCLMLRSYSEDLLVEVRVGQHDVTEVDCDDENMKACTPPYQDIAVEEAIPYPGFDGRRRGANTKFQHDIGLIRLASPIDLSQMNVVPICLPLQKAYREKPLNNMELWISGWGETEEGTPSQNLLSEKIPYVPNDQCAARYNQSIANGIGFRQLCAGGNLDEGGDVCDGDAGGPLQAKEYFDGRQRYVQYGIVSFGANKCGTLGMPSVYTRVTHYVKWILDTIRP